MCNNQGQEAVVLFGNRDALAGDKTALTVQVSGRRGVLGSRVRLLGKDGAALGTQEMSGSQGRGGQQPPYARFVVPPGIYRVEVRSSAGVVRAREVTVGKTALRVALDLD